MRRVGNLSRNALLTSLFLMLFSICQNALADQNHATLDALFEQLKKADSNNEARAIESRIWAAWLEAPDDNAESLMSQISAAMSVGQYQLALRLCDQLVDSRPDYAEAWNKRATVQYLLGSHGYSVADIKETLVREPRHFGALSGLGLIFMASGNYAAAVDAFEAVLALSPASDNARGSLAQAKALIGNDI